MSPPQRPSKGEMEENLACLQLLLTPEIIAGFHTLPNDVLNRQQRALLKALSIHFASQSVHPTEHRGEDEMSESEHGARNPTKAGHPDKRARVESDSEDEDEDEAGHLGKRVRFDGENDESEELELYPRPTGNHVGRSGHGRVAISSGHDDQPLKSAGPTPSAQLGQTGKGDKGEGGKGCRGKGSTSRGKGSRGCGDRGNRGGGGRERGHSRDSAHRRESSRDSDPTVDPPSLKRPQEMRTWASVRILESLSLPPILSIHLNVLNPKKDPALLFDESLESDLSRLVLPPANTDNPEITSSVIVTKKGKEKAIDNGVMCKYSSPLEGLVAAFAYSQHIRGKNSMGHLRYLFIMLWFREYAASTSSSKFEGRLTKGKAKKMVEVFMLTFGRSHATEESKQKLERELIKDMPKMRLRGKRLHILYKMFGTGSLFWLEPVLTDFFLDKRTTLTGQYFDAAMDHLASLGLKDLAETSGANELGDRVREMLKMVFGGRARIGDAEDNEDDDSQVDESDDEENDESGELSNRDGRYASPE